MKKISILAGAFASTLFLAACASATATPAVAPATQAPEPTQVVQEESDVDPEPTEIEEPAPLGQEFTFAPGLLAGGPKIVKADSSSSVRWILPGPRVLDPDIFGTPDQPLGFRPDVGLPLEARLLSDDGSAYTTTAGPTAFSDNFMDIGGTFEFEAFDATLIDGPDSQDKLDFTASFTGPNGLEYSITVLKVIPKGPDHPFFGGVATNVIHHGATTIGTMLMPQVYTYVAFWGVAELTIDGEVVASNRLIHGMLTADVRDEDYKVTFDAGVNNEGIQFHLILPPIELTPDGPQDSPVPSGFILPNGVEQPFLHIMFEDVTISAAQVLLGG
jgi:hypothetical protein